MLSGRTGGPAGWARRLAATVVTLVAAPALMFATAGPARADAIRNQQMWVLDAVRAPAAWRVTQGKGVTVAVIDSGVNPHVSDLAGSVVPGPDLTGVSTPPSNPYWGVHGTWMASLIAGHGHGHGSAGIMGVAPAAHVLSIRVVTDHRDPGYQQYKHESDGQIQGALARAIDYAVTHGASVISMSLGYGAPSLPVRAAIQHALERGTVIVASSGNSGEGHSGHAPYTFPAEYPGVLGVGAIARNGKAAGFSSDNLSVAVAAPGVDVPTQGRGGHYWKVTGTSPACALTAGVAALIKSLHPALSPALVGQAITTSARNRPPGGYDDQVGFGTVDAAAALTAASRLSHDTATAHGVSVTRRFGNSRAAVPPVPVRPRGSGRLILFGVLGLVCLVLVVTAAALLARREWPRAGGRGRGAVGSPPPPTGSRWRHAAPGPGS